jgi:hypothetical protein
MTDETRRALPEPLGRVHRWARAQPWLWRFTLVNRLLLAMAFLPTGLVKATGQRFTTMPVETPVGFFFEALYRTGPYWTFIGLIQVTAALLLLVPQTATLGALLFLPIGLSIVLITWGVGFGNTVYIAAGMLLAVVYLLSWDADRIWAALTHVWGRSEGPPLLSQAHWLERLGWALGGLAGMGLLLSTRSFVPIAFRDDLFWLGVAAAAMVVAGWIATVRDGWAR